MKSNHTHTHTHLTALFPGLPGWASTRKVKPIWILLKQETVSGSGISWAICKSASMQVCISLQTDNHASTPPLKFFTGWMPFLPPNQQCQSTEGQHEVKPVVRNFIQHSRRLICRGYLGGAMRWPSPSAINNNNPVSVPRSTVQYNHL